MKYSVLLLALFLCLSTLPKVVHAAAWLQKKGNTQYISQFSYYYSDHSFNDNGDSSPTNALAKLENNRYIEYGFDDNLTLGTAFRFSYLDADDGAIYDQFVTGDAQMSDFSHASLNIDLFYRQQVYDKNGFVLAFQPLLALPELLYYSNDYYTIGQHNYALEMRGLLGYSFRMDEAETPADKEHLPTPFARQWHFINSEFAYRRLGKFRPDVQDEIKFDTTLGLRLADDWLLLTQNFTTLGAEKLDRIAEIGNSKFQLSAVYRHSDGRALQLSFFEDVWGRNSGKGKGFVIGIWSGF